MLKAVQANSRLQMSGRHITEPYSGRLRRLRDTGMTNKDTPTDDELRLRLNLETAQMPWSELQRWFASGNMIAVGATLDLVEVAVTMARNDAALVQQWMGEGLLAKVSDAQAEAWLAADATPWTVVVRPWILVQLRLS